MPEQDRVGVFLERQRLPRRVRTGFLTMPESHGFHLSAGIAKKTEKHGT